LDTAHMISHPPCYITRPPPPPHYTLSLHDALPISDAGVNPLPPTCTVTAPVPATTLAGVRLVSTGTAGMSATVSVALCAITIPSFTHRYTYVPTGTDRKSTRLNSSHGSISYAVFCLKNNIPVNHRQPTQPFAPL